MTYRIEYHRFIPKDVRRLSHADRERVQRAIETKLTTRPQVFGKPLRRSLYGCWALRVEDHRVVYRIRGETVSVELIAHRSEVYPEAEKRLHGG